MNKVIFMGRLTRDPEVRYGGSDNQSAIASFDLAVDRKFKRQGDSVTADFFSCTAFSKTGEFVERYLKKGMKVLVTGRLQNNNYTNRDGQKVYGFKVIVEEVEFCENKQQSNNATHPDTSSDQRPLPQNNDYGWMNIPDGVDDPEMPFN